MDHRPPPILFVGTVHSDPRGCRKSLAVLERVRPDLILVELSPYGYRYRQTKRRQLHGTFRRNLKKAAQRHGISPAQALKHPQIVLVHNQISMPFEYRAAARYSRQRNVPLALVDSSDFSRERIAGWDELLSPGNLETLLSLPAERTSTTALYELAGKAISASSEPACQFPAAGRVHGAEEAWAARERYLAAAIRHKVAQFHPRQPLYLGGWWHLTRGTAIPTLRDLLELESFQCVLLQQATARHGRGHSIHEQALIRVPHSRAQYSGLAGV